MTTTHTAARVTGTRPQRITVSVTLDVEHSPHLLHAVDQVLTALQSQGIEPLDVQAFTPEDHE